MLDKLNKTINLTTVPQSQADYNPLSDYVNSDERYVIFSIDDNSIVHQFKRFLLSLEIGFKEVQGRSKIVENGITTVLNEPSFIVNARNWEAVKNSNYVNNQMFILYLSPIYTGYSEYGVKSRKATLYFVTPPEQVPDGFSRDDFNRVYKDLGYLVAVNHADVQDHSYTYSDGMFYVVKDKNGNIVD